MSRSYQRFRLPSGWRSFLQHDGGGVTVFAVIAFSMLLVMIGLIVDVGRVMNVHSESGSYVDRAALAAAAELDGRPCAVVRAVAAVTGRDGDGCSFDQLIPSGRRLTLSGDSFVRVQRMTFYSSLNPQIVTARWERGNQNPSYTSGRANAHRSTRFVVVETTRETEQFLFFPMLGGSLQNATVAQRATAGFERHVCNAIPLMMCNPDERWNGGSGGGPFTSDNESHVPSLHYAIPYYDWRSENNWEYSLLRVPVAGHDALRAYLENGNPNTVCYRDKVDTVRVERDFTRGERNAILEAFDSRERERLAAAVVNCRQYRTRLNTDQPVPVEAWAEVRVDGVDYDDHRFDDDGDPADDPHEHYELDLQIEGIVSSNISQGTVREFPVLVR